MSDEAESAAAVKAFVDGQRRRMLIWFVRHHDFMTGHHPRMAIYLQIEACERARAAQLAARE